MKILSRCARSFKIRLKRLGCFFAAFFLRKWSYPLLGVPSGLSDSISGKKILYQKVPLKLNPPKSIEKAQFWRHKELLKNGAEIPEQVIFEVPHGIATALGGNLNPEGKLLTPYLQAIDGKAPHEHDLFRLSSKQFFPRVYYAKKPVITLTSGWQGAFYHWVFEVLPRLHLTELAGYGEEQIFLEAKAPFQVESLELMGIGQDRIINSKEYDAVQSPKIIVSSIPSVPSFWGCSFLRQKILPQLKKGKTRRIYISRNDAGKRRVINEKEVLAFLAKFHFECHTLSSLSFKKQAELFYSAEAIIGPHGAGFSHLVFCDRNIPILEFFHPAYTHNCYWQISHCVNLSYHYLFGLGERYPDGIVTKLDPDMEIDIDQLAASLKLMGLSP